MKQAYMTAAEIRKKERESKLEIRLLRDMADAGLPEPVREHRFHNTRMWRFDLCYPALQVAIECEGGTYSRGRHVRG